VPIRELMFSSENHVDSSTVQQTLATMDSYVDSLGDVQEERFGGRCRAPCQRIVFGILYAAGVPICAEAARSYNTKYQHYPTPT
jgi:hypothetical protein